MCFEPDGPLHDQDSIDLWNWVGRMCGSPSSVAFHIHFKSERGPKRSPAAVPVHTLPRQLGSLLHETCIAQGQARSIDQFEQV